MKAFWKLFFYFIGRQIIMAHVLCIADSHIKDEVHWQNNPKSTPKYEAENMQCRWTTLLEGNKVYTLIRMHSCNPVCLFLFGMPIFCKQVG